ncbi:MAG: HEAT repeat domain-containing protein [Desulfomonilaceae bacterium]|nr:HEAT repeat domain-containing protein [Desulfomonilaceae bacterium]
MEERKQDAERIRTSQNQEQDAESRRTTEGLKYLALIAGLVIIPTIVALPLIDRLIALYAEKSDRVQIPPNIKAMGSDDLMALLSSRNVTAVAYAVQELGNRRTESAVLQLIDRLDNNDSLQVPGMEASTSVAHLAIIALASITRHRIELHPGNIALLSPLMESANGGTSAERAGAIAVLGRVREPLAVPLLSKLVEHGDDRVRDAAARALETLRLPPRNNLVAEVLHRDEAVYLAGLCIVILVSLGTTAIWVRRRIPAKSVLLFCMPVVLVVWITLLAGIEFSVSIAVDKTIDRAVQTGNFLSLKAMLYDEFDPYPGDSYVARYLVEKGNDRVVYCLTQLPSSGPDDDKNYKEFLAKRIDWILSRIVSLKIADGSLEELLESEKPSVRATIVDALGKLGVKDEAISEVLKRLTLDPHEAVRATARKALGAVKQHPARQR